MQSASISTLLFSPAALAVSVTLLLLALHWPMRPTGLSGFVALTLRAGLLLAFGWFAIEEPAEVVSPDLQRSLLVRTNMLPPRAHALEAPLSANAQHEVVVPDPDLQLDAVDTLATAALAPELVAAHVRLMLVGSESVRVPPAFTRLEVFPGAARDPLVLSEIRLLAPLHVAAGGDVPLTVRGVARAAVAAELALREGTRTVATMRVDLAAGAFELPLEAADLPDGRHSLVLEVRTSTDSFYADAEVIVENAPTVAVVSPEGASHLSAWLVAQGARVTDLAAADLAAREEARTARVLVLDRVPAQALAAESVLQVLESRGSAGLGWMFVPSGTAGELQDPAAAAFAALLPCRELPPPPPPPPDKKPEDEQPDPDTPPDPDARHKEERTAPTLGLLIAIDASGSMQGEALRLAKEAAWAAAKVLHPEDHVGVIAFNKKAREILSFTVAAKADEVKDRIARIQCGGGTDFTAALHLAADMFEAESFGVKHLILLSDGESEPGRFEALAREVHAIQKVTISCVGCGPELQVRDLSNVAAAGGGKFYPAWSLEEVPQVFTIEAERVIAGSGARHAPKDEPATAAAKAPDVEQEPRPQQPDKPAEKRDVVSGLAVAQAAPVAFLEGVDVKRLPLLQEFLRLEARSHATVVLEAGGRPVLAHGQNGAARVLQWAMPFDQASQPWHSSSEAQRLFAQGASWSEGRDRAERWQGAVIELGRQVFFAATDLFGAQSETVQGRVTFTSSGKSGARDVQQRSPTTCTFNLPDEAGVLLLEVQDAEGTRVLERAIAVQGPRADARALPEDEGLARWRRILELRPARAVRPPLARLAGSRPVEDRTPWVLAVTCVLGLAAERRATSRWRREKKA